MSKIGTVTLSDTLSVGVEKFSIICEPNGEVWVHFACMFHETYPGGFTPDEEDVIQRLKNPETWSTAIKLRFEHIDDYNMKFETYVLFQNELGNIEDTFTGGLFKLRTQNSSSMTIEPGRIVIHRNPKVDRNKDIVVELTRPEESDRI